MASIQILPIMNAWDLTEISIIRDQPTFNTFAEEFVRFSEQYANMSEIIDRLLTVLESKRQIELMGFQYRIFHDRLKTWLEKKQISDLEALLREIETINGSMVDEMIDELLVKTSFFFRTCTVFELMSEYLIPQILDRKNFMGSTDLRIWSAGCSTGDEAYSIAIVVHEVLNSFKQSFCPLILATDTSEPVLEIARKGVYRRENLRDMKVRYLDQFFKKKSHSYYLCSMIKKMVCFSRDDLMKGAGSSPTDSIFGSFDMVVCRNVLIYYSGKKRDKILAKLNHSLVDDGYLILGETESLPPAFKNTYRTVDARVHIYQKIS